MTEFCSCVYVDSDGSEAEFLTVKKARARKDHVCGECGRAIEIGEWYERAVGKWEGGFNTHKTCTDCLSIRKEFYCEGYFFEFILEFLREHITNVGGQISEDCILRLTPKAQEMVCSMIDDHWQKETYESIIGKPVEVTIEESVLRGGERCSFTIKFT